MPSPIACSIQVLTHNNAPTIRQCLESLADFGEVIVQDGYSTDGTREIAREFLNVTLVDQNRKYLDEDGYITHFSLLRNETIASAKYDWIFPVDADEMMGSVEGEEIRQIVRRGIPGVYVSFRRFYVNGEKMDYCSGYPALQIRLFHRALIIDGYRKEVHELLHMKPGVKTQMMKAEHPVPMASAQELWPKYRRYIRMDSLRHAPSWRHWLRWILLRNLRTVAVLIARTAWIWLIPRRGKRMPLVYEWQAIACSLMAIGYNFPPVVRYRS